MTHERAVLDKLVISRRAKWYVICRCAMGKGSHVVRGSKLELRTLSSPSACHSAMNPCLGGSLLMRFDCVKRNGLKTRSNSYFRCSPSLPPYERDLLQIPAPLRLPFHRFHSSSLLFFLICINRCSYIPSLKISD